MDLVFWALSWLASACQRWRSVYGSSNLQVGIVINLTTILLTPNLPCRLESRRAQACVPSISLHSAAARLSRNSAISLTRVFGAAVGLGVDQDEVGAVKV